jgi:ribonuclease HI
MSEPIIIYTDGSCLNNPGPGGIGIVMRYGSSVKEISRGFRNTTNNRMELLAVIEALKAIKKEGFEIVIYSDSNYVVQAITEGWIFEWKKKKFKKKKNPDLWQQFLLLYPKHKVKFKWIRSHIGIPDNERCDYLAKSAAMNPDEVDEYYEKLGDEPRDKQLNLDF